MKSLTRNFEFRLSNALFILLACTQFACTKNQDAAQINIVMPTATGSSKVSNTSTTSQSVSASGTDQPFNSAINPTAGNQINCFAVFVGGGELIGNSCGVGVSTTQATPLRFGPNVGFVYAGKSVAIETPPGQRIIHVVGLYAATEAACSSYAGDARLDKTNLSEPFLIASQPANIPSGQSSVAIAPVFDPAKKLFNCSFAGSGGGTTTVAPFGDKRDGSFSPLPTPTPINAGTSTMVGTTTLAGDSSLSGTKVFAASRRIISMPTSGTDAGRLLTLGLSYTSSEFEVGDEVAWYVAAGSTSVANTGPDDDINGACGGALYLGRYGTARVTGVPSSTQVLIDNPIGAPATVRVANLSQAPGPDFCTIILSRVSSFDTISVPATKTQTISVQPFSYSTSTGGFLMIRAQTIEVGSGATLTIDGSGKGFEGGSGALRNQGNGVTKVGDGGSGANYNGGAHGTVSSTGGGGGGHAGSGATGMTGDGTVANGGSVVNHCNGPCLPFASYKAFLGGGGGGAGSGQNGGNGGAFIIVMAKTITGSGGTLNIYSKGLAGGGGGSAAGGGGAGGTIGLFNKTSSITNLNLMANGGNGGTATNLGGGGGGGVINFVRCFAQFSTTTFVPSYAGGTGGVSPAGAGVSNVDNSLAACLF